MWDFVIPITLYQLFYVKYCIFIHEVFILCVFWCKNEPNLHK